MKLKSMLVLMIVAILLIGCQSSNIKEDNNEVETTNQKETKSENNENGDETTMIITINNKAYEIELENNETVSTLTSLLPLSLTMDELNGNEKYVYVNQSFPTNAKNPGTIFEGDIMLYGNNCLVLFYDTFDTSYQYTRIGHIKNTTDLKETVGKGSIQVKFDTKK